VKALHAIVKVYDVGLCILLIVRAASCTPGSPLDLRLVRLGVRGKSVCTTFLLARCPNFSGHFPQSTPLMLQQHRCSPTSSVLWTHLPASLHREASSTRAVGAQWLACVTLRMDAQGRPALRSAPPLMAEAVQPLPLVGTKHRTVGNDSGSL